jgi:hypothetical protein
MPASAPSRRRLRGGFATACLILAQLSAASCGGENDRRQSAAVRASALISFLPADSIWGADAAAIKVAMDEQIGELMSQSIADWALLDSMGVSSSGGESSSSTVKQRPLGGLGSARIILAGLRRPLLPSSLERTIQEHSKGPTTENGATVESREKVTVWDEGGKIGMMLEIRSTATRGAGGTTVRTVREIMQRTEVKFCPDAQGISPGTWEYTDWQENSFSSPSGDRLGRGQVRAGAALTGQVDDEAELTRILQEMKVTYRGSTKSGARDFTPVIGYTTDGAGNKIPGKIEGLDGSESSNNELLGALEDFAEIVLKEAYNKARFRWRDKRCVEIAFLAGKDKRRLSPGERVRIVAEARHKEEGGKVPAPLEASLFAYQSITPDRKRIPPPAEFTYQAPEDGTEEAEFMREKGTTVRVSSTSRRGIGESVIEYRLGSGPSYQVKMQVRQQAEKLGTTYDVTYEAKLEPGPDGELQGSGSYRGTELSWKVACSDVDQDPNAETHPVSGKLKATGSAVDMGGNTMLMFSLETLDFPPPPGWSGEVDPEVKGRGTVGNLGVTLTGQMTSKTVKGEGDLMGFSSETPCTGKFTNTQETTVQLVQ